MIEFNLVSLELLIVLKHNSIPWIFCAILLRFSSQLKPIAHHVLASEIISDCVFLTPICIQEKKKKNVSALTNRLLRRHYGFD